MPNLTDHSYKISGDLTVTETTIEYNGNRVYTCQIVRFEESKVKRARAYFGEPFEAPEGRA